MYRRGPRDDRGADGIELALLIGVTRLAREGPAR